MSDTKLKDHTQEWIHDSMYGHLHLRDFFAAFAVAGIIASDGNPHAIGERWAAVAAYTMADAMLAQREQDQEKNDA